MAKKILLIGDTPKVKEFAAVLQNSASVMLAENLKTGLLTAKAMIPDAIVFIVPVYWENLLPFIEEVKKEASLRLKPIIYVGDFIEATDQTVLKRAGVHTITLGPVPTQEVARFILSLA
jgi:hypothetical protein